MHDGLPSYTNVIPQQNHLYCWANVLRFAHEETAMEQEEGSQAKWLSDQLVKVYHIEKEPSLSCQADLEARLREELEKRLAVQSQSPSVQNIQARLRGQKDGLIRSPVVCPDGTNNLAERELRPRVINHRISNGSNTFTGMETSAILASLVQTVGKKKPRVFPLYKGICKKASKNSSTTICIPSLLTPPNSSSFEDS